MSVSFSWSKAGDNAVQNVQKPAVVDAKQTVPITDQSQRVHDAWNPQSPACAFQHYFYNRVPAEQVQQYVMPPGQDPQKWERAMIARPDPASVPVLAVGFTDLEKRINSQNQQVNAYRVRMHEINDKSTESSNRHDSHTTVKSSEMRERHNRLAKRASELAIRIQVLSNRGHVLTPQEESFQRRVKELIQRADDPAVFGSLNEAWARVKAFKERDEAASSAKPGLDRRETSPSARSAAQTGSAADSSSCSLDWETNAAQLELIVKVSAAQQKGITFLAQLIENDTQLVDEDLGLVPRKPKQKALPVTTVAPQSFAAQIPSSHALAQQQSQLQQQQQQQQQQPAQTGGLFAANSQPQQPQTQSLGTGSGLFGAKPASSSLFGGSAAQQPQQQQSGGSFGQSTQQQPAQTGGLFGQKPAQTSGGLFGGSTTTSTQPGVTQPQSGGLFGNQSAPAGQQQQQTGGLFGQKPATSGLFGQQQPQQQPQQQTGGSFGQKPASTTGGGLFGQPQQPQQQQQPQQSGGLFGQSTQQQSQPASGGLFGQPTQQQPASGGSFGQNTQNQPQQSGGGSFGQNNNQSGGSFGQAKPFGSGSGLFGK